MSAERVKVEEFQMSIKDRARLAEAPALRESMRDTHIAADKETSAKIRFGLFSQPGPVAIGETNKFPKTQCRKDPEEGFVIIGPRNFTTKPIKRGSVDAIVLFSEPSYICRNDPYKPAIRDILRLNGKNAHLPLHEMPYKPAKIVRDNTCMKASYAYMPKDVYKKKNFRDPEDNSVVIGPRNFTTMPLK
jgi:hypothetical protein